MVSREHSLLHFCPILLSLRLRRSGKKYLYSKVCIYAPHSVSRFTPACITTNNPQPYKYYYPPWAPVGQQQRPTQPYRRGTSEPCLCIRMGIPQSLSRFIPPRLSPRTTQPYSYYTHTPGQHQSDSNNNDQPSLTSAVLASLAYYAPP